MVASKKGRQTVHKTELQDRQMNKKVQRGMEDGLIYGERREKSEIKLDHIVFNK